MTPERESKVRRVLNNRQSGLVMVLENVHDLHNVSAVMRTCDAVGVQDVFVLNNGIPTHKRFSRTSSANALGWITIHQYSNTAECMAAVRQQCDKIYATHLGVESSSLYEQDLTQKVAVVFGNERQGVTAECLSHCDGNFIIPQVGMVQSLNISVACAITLYEAFRQRNLAGFYDGTPSLPEAQWNSIAKEWRMYDTTTSAAEGMNTSSK
jgi:tRNA (guanosine-2'-O-)-methyltransferase